MSSSYFIVGIVSLCGFCFSTFVCPTEIIAFSDRVEEFRRIGCEVIAASCDSHFSHLAWVNTSRKEGGLGSMAIPLLADKSGKIARSYGVYDEETGIPFRGLFIIDKKGVSVTLAPYFSVGFLKLEQWLLCLSRSVYNTYLFSEPSSGDCQRPACWPFCR